MVFTCFSQLFLDKEALKTLKLLLIQILKIFKTVCCVICSIISVLKINPDKSSLQVRTHLFMIKNTIQLMVGLRCLKLVLTLTNHTL